MGPAAGPRHLRLALHSPAKADSIMRWTASFFRLLPVLAFLGHSAALGAGPRPNIIYILADDLGYGDLACYGQTKFATPHIDALAKRGIRFTQHYSGSTVCAPSRSALLTGLHTGRTPIRGNTEVLPEGQGPLPGTTVTLAERLQEAGYRTGLFGKWGLGYPGSEGDPLKQGFRRFYGYNCQRQGHHYYPYFLWDDNQRVLLWENFDRETGEYAPETIQRQALAFLEDRKEGEPFFLYYAHIIPHAEMYAPEADMARFRGRFGKERPYQGTDSGPEFRKGNYESQKEPRTAFAAMVTVLDRHVGEIVAKLDELGLSENTLILFSSDNGPHREGGHDPDFFDSNGPFRGYKRDLYEGGIRVPLIATWPGTIAPGRDSDHISAQWDLLPTFCEVAGLPVPAGLDGLSFLPELKGTGAQAPHQYLYWEFHELKGRVAIRKGKWKGVRYQVAVKPDSPLELYDLENDPGETKNVAARHPQVAARLDKLIKEARTPSPNPQFNFPAKRPSVPGADAHRR